MRFLITNDDGADAAGIALLASVASELGEIVMVAPAEQQSGISHRVTFDTPLQVSQTESGTYCVLGTPADCVRFGISQIGGHFDWVLSGVNDGANLGVDVYYSGTVAAAREATFFGIPAVALSQYRKNQFVPFDWQSAGNFETVRRILTGIFERGSAPQTLVNVNLPDCVAAANLYDIEIIDCDVDMSPLPPEYRESHAGLLTSANYAQRPRVALCDIDTCFSGKVSVSYLR